MGKSKKQKVVKRDVEGEQVQQPTPPAQDEVESGSDVDFIMGDDDSGPEDKDAAEEELERLVFGDNAGFRQGLKDFTLENEDNDAEDEEEEDAGQSGLEGLDDAALFMTDLTPGHDLYQPPASDEDDELESKHPAAWEDSDDERMMVSLATVPRLRKLRRTEAEDLVSGKEYSKRLRQQFELLNPRPEWARNAMGRPARKKQRTLDDEGSSDDEAIFDDDVDMDGDVVPNVAPLAKLLQDAESLVKEAGKGVGKKRKIRPETLDIQRTKDIPGIQPSAITSLSFHPNLPLLLSSGPSSTLYLHHLAPSPPAPTPNPLLTSLHIRGAPLTTTAFHPTDSRIFLSARRRYFHIWNLHTGQIEKITRVYGQQHEQRSMERFKLSPDGQHMALLGSARKGGGVINILSASTLQWTAQVRVESRGGVAEFAWWRDSKGLCIAAKTGEITEWSLHSRRTIARWQDEGAVGTTTLALGGQHEFVKSPIGNDRWVAIGSSSGIVNIYDRRVWLANPAAAPSSAVSSEQQQPVPAAPKPTKTLDHLTTPTSLLQFSHDGQVLAMASKWKRDALKLVQLPSCAVFKNWPTSSTPLGRITGVAFAGGDVVSGAGGGGGGGGGGEGVYAAMAVANEQGKVRVWEIR